MDQRREFVMLAKQEDVNLRKLCRQFGISAPISADARQRDE
jgi:transposase-like protein